MNNAFSKFMSQNLSMIFSKFFDDESRVIYLKRNKYCNILIIGPNLMKTNTNPFIFVITS